MATLLEDERDALEERRLAEQERLQLEEAALLEQQAIAAQQQQSLPPIPQGGNYMNQPQGEINALQAHFNEIAQGRGLPATRTTDSQEYLDEVAKAQRNSGFINANVSDFGEVIQQGYDPMRDPVAIKAQAEATNLQRQNYVDSLIKGGATYAEAYRAGQGRYPQTGNEAMRLRVEQLAQKQAPENLMQPEVVEIDGVKMFRTGPRTFAKVNETKSTKAEMPPDSAANQKVITGQIAETRRDLERAKKVVEGDPGDTAAVRRALIYQNRLSELEKSLVTGSTNWQGMAQAPVASSPATPAQVPAKTVIKYDKSGKGWIVDPTTKKVIGPA